MPKDVPMSIKREAGLRARSMAAMVQVERGETITHAGVEGLYKHLGI